jgi:hypothetical protein
MAAFLRYKAQLITGATLCSFPILNEWWKNKGKHFGQKVVFAHENPAPGGADKPSETPSDSAYAGYNDPPVEVRHYLIDSVPQLKKRKTDPKYIQLPPPLEKLTLKNVHVFFRHGARLPLRPSPMEQVNTV